MGVLVIRDGILGGQKLKMGARRSPFSTITKCFPLARDVLRADSELEAATSETQADLWRTQKNTA